MKKKEYSGFQLNYNLNSTYLYTTYRLIIYLKIVHKDSIKSYDKLLKL